MDNCLTYLEFSAFVDALGPLFLATLFFAGYGLISLLLQLCVYLDRVLFRHLGPRPCSDFDGDSLSEKDRGHK